MAGDDRSSTAITCRLTPNDLRALADLMERLNDPDIVIGRDDHERPTAGCTLARATVLLDADRWVTIELAGGFWRLCDVQQAVPNGSTGDPS